jgi:hypothetical protein
MKSYGGTMKSITSPMIYIPMKIATSDFGSDYSELADNLDDLGVSSNALNVNEEKMNSMNKSYGIDGDFTSIFSKEITPISVFGNFFTEKS